MTLSNQIIDRHFDVDSMNKKKLEGNEIDFIRKCIKTIISEKGVCPVETLGIMLKTKYPKFCKPLDWAGFKTLKEMI